MRLIDADAFKENMERKYGFYARQPQDDIDAQPTVEAVPVVHGFLKKVPYKNFDPPDLPYGNEVDEETGWTFEWDTKTVCSVCCHEPKSFKPNYCENCGAKMDENGGE